MRHTLVLMAGHPGSGKSTVAHALGRALGWPVLDKDPVKSTLIAVMPSDADLATLGLDLDRIAYDLLHALVVDLVAQQGLSLILDTPALREHVVQQLAETAHTAGVLLKVIVCRADLQTRNERLRRRAGMPSQRTSHTVDTDIEKHFGHLPPDSLILQTDRSLDELVAEAMAYIRA